MKRRRLQRQSSRLFIVFSLLIAILLAGLSIYINLRGEALLNDFKIFVEKGLSETFGDRVSIGEVKGGIFYPIRLYDITVHTLGDEKIFESKEVVLNYHLWNILFVKNKRICRMRLVTPKFFILAKEKDETKVDLLKSISKKFKDRKNMAFGQEIYFDITDGSIRHAASQESIVKDIYGRVIVSGDTIDLKKIKLFLYELSVDIDGEIDGIYSDAPLFDAHLNVRNDYIAVDAYIENPNKDIKTKGSLKVGDNFSIDFAGLCEFSDGRLNVRDTALADVINIEEGYIDLSKEEFSLKLLPQNGNATDVTISGGFSSWPKFSLYTGLKHWHAGSMDITTDISVEAELKEKSGVPVITGTLNTEKSIINYKPCRELSLHFTVRKKAVEILGFKWGKSFRLVGKLEFDPPHNIELIALLDGTKLEELLSFGPSGAENLLAGTVKGRLEIEGPLNNPVSRGQITSRDGRIGDVYFENAVIHLLGKGPLITIGDSRIYRETGYLLLNGEIDLRKFGKRNLFENIVIKTDDQSIVWEGWDITKESAGDEVNLKKKISEDWEVGFTAPLESDDTSWEKDEESEVELRYKIRDNESLKMQIKEEEEFLGVEHKIKF